MCGWPHRCVHLLLQTYSQLAHPIQQAKALGLQLHSRVLDIDNVDVSVLFGLLPRWEGVLGGEEPTPRPTLELLRQGPFPRDVPTGLQLESP